MKLSLILQAIDRWSKPTRDAAKATRELGDASDKASARVRRFATDSAYAERVAFRFGRSIRRGAISAVVDLRARANEAGNAVGRLGRSLAISAAGAGLRAAQYGLTGILAAAVAAPIALAKGVIDVTAKFEDFEAVLTNTLGSKGKAQSALDWITKFAAKTPYELDGVTAAYVKLVNYGIDPTSGALRTLGDTASGMNKDLDQAVEALADAVNGEFERLKEFGVKASAKGKQVSFAYAIAGKQMQATARKDAGDIQRVLLGIFDSKFKGLMDVRSRTFNGMMSNLADAWTLFQLRIGRAGFFDKAKSGLQGILDWVAKLTEDGTLDRWAKMASDRLGELWDAADKFIRQTDWESVARGMGSIVSTLTSIIGWIGKAANAWEDWDLRVERSRNNVAINSKGLFGTGYGAPSAAEKTRLINRNLDINERLGQIEYGGAPTPSSAPARRAPRPQARGPISPDFLRYRPNATGPGSGPLRPGAAPVPARPQRSSLEIILKGDGAKQASAGRIAPADDQRITVTRGRAMGIPA